MAIYSLTPTQAHCARIYAELWTVLGRQPSIQEVADELCTIKNTAYYLIGQLLARGWLVRFFGQDSRGVHGWSWRLTREPPPLPTYAVEITPLGLAQLRQAA